MEEEKILRYLANGLVIFGLSSIVLLYFSFIGRMITNSNFSIWTKLCWLAIINLSLAMVCIWILQKYAETITDIDIAVDRVERGKV